MNTVLLDRIEKLAGCQRNATFRKAAEFILKHRPNLIVETGCYRGIDGDGHSTLIFALLARELECGFFSYDLNQDPRIPIDKATELVKRHGVADCVHFEESDSVIGLSRLSRHVGFAYLDSYDHDANNPWPCQRHQLAEVGAILGKMTPPCAILLDDHVPETGGKTALSAAFLAERGWQVAAEGYQLLFVKS